MGYDVPTAYAQLIGPRYGVIADRLLEAACVNRDDDVLEVGAGTGVVTVRAAPMARSVVATDLSAPMLENARQSLCGAQNVSYLVVDYGSPLPFLPRSFTLVLSGLTYVQDSLSALREVHRVLRPGGRLALSMWGSSYHEKRLMNAALKTVAGQRFPPASPATATRRLERAGFSFVQRSDIELTNHFASVDDYIAYRRGFGKPTAWTHSLYRRFLDVLATEASKTATPEGAFDLGWKHTIIIARRP
jgi:ubiquinone/menaquinone biosynthesis C-methylase UbiE